MAACGLGGASVWAGGGARSGPARVRRAIMRGGARVERLTENMRPMVVTPDVSKFSVWLNARANCQVKRTAFKARVGSGLERRRRCGGEGGGGRERVERT